MGIDIINLGEGSLLFATTIKWFESLSTTTLKRFELGMLRVTNAFKCFELGMLRITNVKYSVLDIPSLKCAMAPTFKSFKLGFHSLKCSVIDIPQGNSRTSFKITQEFSLHHVFALISTLEIHHDHL